MAEPRTDPFWSGQGEELEDLSRLHEAQPWTPEGMPLSRSAFTTFAAAEAGLLRGPRVSDEAAVEELHHAGLVDGSGRLTEDGRSTHTLLRSADRRIRVESAAAGVPGTYEAARVRGSVVVWATDSPQTWAGTKPVGKDRLASATTGTLMWLPTMHLAADLAAWLQVGPAWPMALSPDRLPRELVAQRTDDATAPPPSGADEHLREIWGQPWFTWTLTSDTEHRVAGVHAGRHGHLRLTDEGDEVVLSPLPSEPLFAILVGMSLL